MKKQSTFLLLIIALVFSSVACGRITISPRVFRGNGDVVEETRQVGSFDEVQLSGIGNLYIEYGDEESLIVEAEENLMRYIETDIQTNKLTINLGGGKIVLPTKDMNFYLTVVELDSVSITGIGRIYLSEVNTPRFDIRVSGAGALFIDELFADRLDVVLSGIGEIDIDSGGVDFQSVHISGPGTYSARRLTSNEANVNVSGIGKAIVNVEDYLEARVSGPGDLTYYGSAVLDANVSGLGNLHAMDE
jgi:hypothetical protein